MGITLHVLHVDSLCDKPNIFLEQMDTWDIKVKFWILLRNLAKFGLNLNWQKEAAILSFDCTSS